MTTPKYATVVIIALVALRLGCGWLFYREGSKKVDGGKFTSQPFLRDAKGPLAGLYLGMIADPYGDQRQQLKETRKHWEFYYSEAGYHFDFDDEQMDEAEAAFQRAVAKLQYFLETTAVQRDKNSLETERLAEAEEDPTASVNYRKSWIEKQDRQVDSEMQGWLRKIDAIWASYEKDVNDIARQGLLDLGGDKTITQYDYYGEYPLPVAGAPALNSSFADTVIPWFTFGVGVLLVLGLFTRLAAIGGSLFLLSVVASQPPFVAGTVDTNYQIVLLLGLLVVAAVGAGRWGGLDFFLGCCWNKCCGRTPSENTSSEN